MTVRMIQPGTGKVWTMYTDEAVARALAEGYVYAELVPVPDEKPKSVKRSKKK